MHGRLIVLLQPNKLIMHALAETIRKGIADYRCFESQPELLMYGCMWVIFSVGVWLFLASFLEMPVSTTHSCVGGMIGKLFLS